MEERKGKAHPRFTEFPDTVEGDVSPKFMDLVLRVHPDQDYSSAAAALLCRYAYDLGRTEGPPAAQRGDVALDGSTTPDGAGTSPVGHIEPGEAKNLADSAASLVDDAEAYAQSRSEENLADLLASMRILQRRIGRALATMGESSADGIFGAVQGRA